MKVSIIIPVFNEQATIYEIVTKVKVAKLPVGFSREIIVVDDASTDKTRAILKKMKIQTILHRFNRGKGAAIVTGVSKSKGDLILIQDADLEYNPQDYIRLLTPFKDKNCLVVYGSRLMDYPLVLFGHNKTPLPFHWLANKFLTLLTNVLYGNSVTDMETCYKVFRSSIFKSLNIQAKRFDFEPEVTAKILRRGIKILEIPIKVKPRDYTQGKKIGWQDGLVAIWTLFKYRFVK